MTDWVGLTATEIASAVRGGAVPAAEVADAHLAQIAARDGEVGAFVKVRAAQAAREAAAVDARTDLAGLPLAGVPVSVKDVIAVAGEPMRVGSAASPALPQQEDHPLVERLRAAGAVVVGLTNLPELAIYPFTDSAHGVTHNPWDLSRTAGGSSGGAAASVAAAMVPLAHGTDGLGSVRIPAAACGLFGIKPGPGLLPGGGGWFGLSESGTLATTVADAALMLGVMAGTTFSLDPPPPLQVAMSRRAPGPGIAVYSSCTAAVRESGGLLFEQGHAVREADPPYPGWLTPMLLSYWVAGPAAEAGPNVAEMEARTRHHVAAGRKVLGTRPPHREDRERLREALAPFFAEYDVLVMPTLAQPCPRALRYGTRSWPRSVGTALRFAPMTGVWNLAGYPAATVPVPPETNGLPGAVQLVTTPGREDLLLSVAAQLEAARPWPRHAPGYAAA
jgi:amidase